MPTEGKKRKASKKSAQGAPVATPTVSASSTIKIMEEKTYYFPPNKSEYAGFMSNFYTRILPDYKDYGITDAELAEIKADSDYMAFISDTGSKYVTTGSMFIATRDIAWAGDPDNPGLKLVFTPSQVPITEEDKIPPSVAPNIFSRWKRMVLRLRQHPKMTDTFAKELGISPRPSSNQNPDDEFEPKPKGKIVNGEAQLNCPVKGFKGYEVWCNDGDTGKFVIIGISVGRYYTDTRPIPANMSAELRTYKVRMLNSKNQPVGKYSAPVSLTVSRAI